MSYYIPFECIVSYGVSAKYIKSAICKYRSNKELWQSKKSETDRRKVLIDLDSIPEHLGAVHQTEEDIKKMQKHAAKKKSYISYIDREIEAINQKGLEYIGKESYDIISPVEIGKEKLNTKESMDFMAYYYGVYNTPVDIVEEAKEQKTKTIATIGKTTSVEDIIVNKSNPIHSQKIGAVVSQPPQ